MSNTIHDLSGSGSTQLEYTTDFNVLETIVNLKDGNIAPVNSRHFWAYLQCEPFVPDMLVLSERIVLPKINWFDIEHGYLVSELDELVKQKILLIPNEPLFQELDCREVQKNISLKFTNDPRNLLIALLANPGQYQSILHELHLNQGNISFTNPWLGGASDITNWLKSVDIQQFYSAVKNSTFNKELNPTAISQAISSEIPTTQEGYYYPKNFVYSQFVHESEQNGLNVILKILKQEKKETSKTAYDILVERHNQMKKTITNSSIQYSTRIQIPYTLPIILDKIDDGKGNRQFYDAILETRKEMKPLRVWLGKFDQAIGKYGFGPETLKCENEINKINSSILSEYKIHPITQNIENFGEFSSILSGIGEFAITNQSSSLFKIIDSITNRIVPKIIEYGEKYVYPHRFYMKSIGRESLYDVKKTLQRKFPKEKEGTRFYDILEYYSVLCEKAKLVAQLK
jgi:hypothetical protein